MEEFTDKNKDGNPSDSSDENENEDPESQDFVPNEEVSKMTSLIATLDEAQSIAKLLLEREEAVAVQIYGIALESSTPVSLLSISTKDNLCYLMDIQEHSDFLFGTDFSNVLESPKIQKVTYHSRMVAFVLWKFFNIRLTNVLDLHIAYKMLTSLERQCDLDLVEAPTLNHIIRHFGKKLYPIPKTWELESLELTDPEFWVRRPLSPIAKQYASVQLLSFFPEAANHLHALLDAPKRDVIQTLSAEAVTKAQLAFDKKRAKMEEIEAKISQSMDDALRRIDLALMDPDKVNLGSTLGKCRDRSQK